MRDWLAITPKALAKIDYVLLDGQTAHADRSRPAWHGQSEGFTDAIVAATVTAMDEEPVDIYGAPTFRHADGAGQFTDAHQQR